MTEPSGAVTSVFTKTVQILESAWSWLARPHPSLNDLGDRRRAQLMMAFALIMGVGMLGPVTMGKGNNLDRLIILVGLLIISFVSYLLGRTRFHQWGSRLLVFGIASMGFALVLTGQANDPSNALNTTLPLVLLAVYCCHCEGSCC